MPYCENCGKELHEDYCFCPECGKEICPVALEQENEQKDIPQKRCTNCGALMPIDMFYCLNCGTSFESGSAEHYPRFLFGREPGTWKNKWVAFLLCLFFGWIGAHKYYETKVGLGIVYTITFGLFGIGWIVDTIVLLFKPNPYLAKKSKTRL